MSEGSLEKVLCYFYICVVVLYCTVHTNKWYPNCREDLPGDYLSDTALLFMTFSREVFEALSVRWSASWYAQVSHVRQYSDSPAKDCYYTWLVELPRSVPSWDDGSPPGASLRRDSTVSRQDSPWWPLTPSLYYFGKGVVFWEWPWGLCVGCVWVCSTQTSVLAVGGLLDDGPSSSRVVLSWMWVPRIF